MPKSKKKRRSLMKEQHEEVRFKRTSSETTEQSAEERKTQILHASLHITLATCLPKRSPLTLPPFTVSLLRPSSMTPKPRPSKDPHTYSVGVPENPRSSLSGTLVAQSEMAVMLELQQSLYACKFRSPRMSSMRTKGEKRLGGRVVFQPR